MLDAEELFHLAIHASSAGNHHACMTYLKEVLQQQPGNAQAIYLLAVQHAELGLTRRALSGMQAAIAIEPGLELARFQLGLMLLDAGRRTDAKEQFDALGHTQELSLRTYAEAMSALATGDTALAQDKLRAGLSLKSGNPALAAVMQRIFDGITGRKEPQSSEPAQNEQIPLGAYRYTSS